MKAIHFPCLVCLTILIFIGKSLQMDFYDDSLRESGSGHEKDSRNIRNLNQVEENVEEEVEEILRNVQERLRPRNGRKYCFHHTHCPHHGYCSNGYCQTTRCSGRRKRSVYSLESDVDNDNFQLDEDEYERNSRGCRTIREGRRSTCFTHSNCSCNRRCNLCSMRCEYVAHRKH